MIKDGEGAKFAYLGTKDGKLDFASATAQGGMPGD
jgi:hypothetical protein